ncbi:MAG: DUF5131 family protein [Flavobacteriaceae bacterium]|nr:DUF5131 family protein [Flavobacteriaceae bacterium]
MSKIEWTDQTWNPTTGCNKVSAGCKNCYAETMAKRLQAMGTPGYENGFEFTLMLERLNQPLLKKKPTKYFVNSMSDLFHEEMPHEYLEKIFDVIKSTPQHTYQILTKREKNMAEYFKNKKLPKNVSELPPYFEFHIRKFASFWKIFRCDILLSGFDLPSSKS